MSLWVRKGDALDVLRTTVLKDVDVVIGSPPYAMKGERYDGISNHWKVEDWVEWMVDVTCHATSVAKHWVVWVVNSPYRTGVYHPACEKLLARCYDSGLRCERPAIWQKLNAPPSRHQGKNIWFSNDWEYVLAFRCGDGAEHFDWQAIANPPKFQSGGDFRQRGSDGKRRTGGEYPKTHLARPKDVFTATVGGGHLGHKLAHSNEAPFPEKLITPLLQVLCPAGGRVLDPFVGSGTTLAACEALKLNGIGYDCRDSQTKLAKARINDQFPEADIA